MFNYLFPIFCFGLVVTGIVFLGIIEARRQARLMDSACESADSPDDNNTSRLRTFGRRPRLATRGSDE